MLAPTPPVNPGTHLLSRELGMSFTIGAEYVWDRLRPLVLSGPVAVDIETYGLGLLGRDVKIIIFGNESEAVIVDPRDPVQATLARWAFEHSSEMILHNSTFDVSNMAAAGYWRPEWGWKVTDTLVYARLAEPSELTKKDLESCGARYLGIAKSGTTMNMIFRELGLTQKEGWKKFDVDRPVYQYGAAMDTMITARLRSVVRKAAYQRITSGHPWVGTPYGLHGSEAWELVEREQILNRIFLVRSAKGLRIDPSWVDEYEATTGPGYSRALESLEMAGVEPGNAKQLTTFLEGQGAIPDFYPKTEKTQAWSTTADNLATLRHPVALAYVLAKQRDHVLKDYLAKCLELETRGRIFPQVSFLAAVTGRMSMANPPIHQFPGPARGIILADEGDSLTSIDWSQVEPVLAANMAKDHGVLAGYEAGTMDFYESIGRAAGVPRKTAKVIVLAQLYGEGIKKLALDLGVSIERAKELREEVFSPMPKVLKLVGNMHRLAERHKKVFTLSGRILPVPYGRGGVGVQTHKGINYLVQGSAYDALADAMIRVHQAGLSDAIYLAMHDELVVSSQSANDVRKIMEEPPTRLIDIAQRTPVLRTDLSDLGPRWAEA